ncbi:MAG: tRNA lysidine(34) synthetase TilS [Clostridiales bacterium]|nr:tRNA lysidine(34) synthetase TilS [Clostridiales bacterium]
MWKTVQKVRKFVEKYEMICPGELLVAGISGGADSVCLLYLLKELQKVMDFQIVAVHVNHHLRGEEAERDENFVKVLCDREGVPLFCVHKDVAQMARMQGISSEEAGRNARYEAFEEIREKNCADKIVLAHHQDDLAETMIHHLARGTGLAGLCSLKPVSGNRIRPLLCLERGEIETCLRGENREWQTDSTNLEDDYTRNKIRHHIIGYLQNEINSRSVSHMAGTAQELGQVEEFLCRIAEEKAERYVKREQDFSRISESLKEEPEILQKKLLLEEVKYRAGARKDFTRIHGEKIWELYGKQVGRQIALPYGLLAVREYDGIWIGKQEAWNAGSFVPDSVENVQLQIPGETKAGEYVISCEIIPCNFNGIEEKTYTKWLDYDKIKDSLVFRHRCPGDRIRVHPSGGSRKLKDYLIDRKIPQKERDGLCMIAEGQEILWIIGDRISQKYKVSDTTRQILHIRIRGGNIHE